MLRVLKLLDAGKTKLRFSKSNVDVALKFEVEAAYAQGKSSSTTINTNVQRLINVIEEYLGKDFRMIKNKSGDPVFINKDNTRVIRFDSNNPHGDIPHGHVQFYDKESKKWLDYTAQHRIYLRATPEFLNKPKPGKE